MTVIAATLQRFRESRIRGDRDAHGLNGRHEVEMNMTRGRGLDMALRMTASFMLAALPGGCVDVHSPEYAPVIVRLDDHNELYISTYPSWFPSETSGIPFLKKTLRTPESVYFQVFVRDAQEKVGPNPHVDSILIKSFSYQLAGRAPVVLIENYDQEFWMQDNPNYNKRQPVPVPWVKGQPLTIAISFVLNGKAHELKTDMQAVERKSTGSLFAHEFLR